jgi:hypothetical protein
LLGMLRLVARRRLIKEPAVLDNVMEWWRRDGRKAVEVRLSYR